MSEYQYYEFQAIDQPLTAAQMQAVRRLSTRAEITPTSFTNEYHFGDFKGNPIAMIERYYDVFQYYANWGTRWFMCRIPRKLIDLKLISKYGSESLSVHTKGVNVIFEFRTENESSTWERPPHLESLSPLREELIDGDLRCLYLAWLRSVQTEEFNPKAQEPPVPPGLNKLSRALKALIKFLDLDETLLKTAAKGSSDQLIVSSTSKISERISNLSPSKKNKLIADFLAGTNPHLRRETLQQLCRSKSLHSSKKNSKRTVGELLEKH